MKIIPLLAVSLVLLFFVFSSGCTQQPGQQGNNTTLVFGANKTLAYGDVALVDYILRVNMTDPATNISSMVVFDTSIQEVANASGILNPDRHYAPLTVNISDNNGYLAGFTRALNLMGEGENKTFTLAAADAYGVYDPQKVSSIPRFYTQSLYDEVPVAYFTARNVSYAVGTNLTSSAYLDATVVNATNDTVTIKYQPFINQTFTVNGLPEQMSFVNDTSMTAELLLVPGTRYVTQGSDGTPHQVLTLAVNDTSITLDANHPLAGKSLAFTVFVRKIQKA
ncbi:FKBP-type peptidyl-prolyl cis-trans isomerase [uncultured archaeon]|nr:FKBP-type peptidyl-prolyl cis-trans isomerase [uncultured archaeon]